MDDAFRSEMKRRLLAEQTTLLDELARLRAISGTQEALSEHAGLGNHMADDATELFEQEKNLTLVKHTADLLAKVESALRRMDEGTYGFCQKCGTLIDHARLEALPYCALCVSCKARQEKA